MKTITKIAPEFYRLNKILSEELGINPDEEKCRKIIEMVI